MTIKENRVSPSSGSGKARLSVRTRILLILLIVWMSVIFFFSSRPANLSAKDSYRTAKFYAEHFVKDFKTWDKPSQESYIKKIDHPVRKIAHASEFAVLGAIFVALYHSLMLRKEDEKQSIYHLRIYVFSVLCSALYACTDEIHQIFVRGRSFQLLDICIDTGGAAIGAFLMTLILVLAQIISKCYASSHSI